MKSLYRLDQFDRVLALRNRDGLPYLLIGGQAVNFWAGLYAVRESALAGAATNPRSINSFVSSGTPGSTSGSSPKRLASTH